MANLQHYIHNKLQNKQRLLRSLKKKKKKQGRKEGRQRGSERLDTCIFFDADKHGVLTFTMWWVKSQYDSRMLKVNTPSLDV